MKRTKKAVSFFMALALIISTTTMFASAATPTLRTTTDWVQMAVAISSFDVSKAGNAVMSATTQGSLDTTEATVDMYLEMLKNGKWVTDLSFSESADDCYLDVYHVRAIARGYNYRLRTVHTATGPRGTDTHEIISTSIWY